MQRAPMHAHNARCLASSETPGAVSIEFRRADGRVVTLQIHHQAAEAFAKRLSLQSKLAALYHDGAKGKGE